MLGEPADAGFDLDKGTVNGFGDLGFHLSANWRHDDFSWTMLFDRIAPQTNTYGCCGGSVAGSLGVFFSQDNFERTMFASQTKYLWKIDDANSLDMSAVLELHDFGPQGIQSFTTSPAAGTTTDFGGSELHYGAKLVYRNTMFDKHSFAIGMSLDRRAGGDTERIFGDEAELGNESVDFDWNEFSLFGEETYAVTDNLNLIFGLRYDAVYYGKLGGGPIARVEDLNTSDESVSPMVGLAYEYDDTTNITASYQHGFRNPDARFKSWELFWEGHVPGTGFQLEPETVDNFQIDLQKMFPHHSLETNFSLFYNRYDDAIRFDFFDDAGEHGKSAALVAAAKASQGFYGQFINADSLIEVIGGEIRSDWKPNDAWKVGFSYSYSNMIENPTNEWERMAEHIAKTNLRRYFLNKDLAVDINLSYNNSFDTTELGTNPIFDDDRIVVDFSVSYEISDELYIKLTGENIFENDVPVMNDRPDNLKNGLIGTDERLFYLSVNVPY